MADAEKSDAPHPHDLLVRNILADADIAADLLRNYLPPEWALALEWDSLKREGGETVAPDLSKLVGDLRYSARFKGSGEELKVFIFLEHQSRPDRFMTFRMLEYVFAAWRRQLSAPEKVTRFPYPLAVVLHHGKKPWKKIPSMRDLIAIPPDATGALPDLSICLIDAAAMPVDQLRGHPMVCALLDSLQSASTGVLSIRMRKILSRLRGLAEERRIKPWVTALARYYTFVQKVVQDDIDDFASVFTELCGRKEAKEMMMTFAETFEKKGIAKGRTEGRAEGKIESMITFLECRFDGIPDALRKKLLKMRDNGDGRIEEMLKLAATCRSLKEFQKAL